MRTLGTARDVIRQIGIRRFLVEIPPWLLRRQYLVYAAAVRPIPAVDHPRVQFDVLREADAGVLASTRPARYSSAGVLTRLQQGHLAIVGRSDGAIVHARWIFVGSVDLPYLHRRLVLAPGEGLLDEVYTVPAWRRRGVESAAAAAMQRMLHRVGFERIICAIAPWNRPPRRVARALGYQRIGDCGYWALPGYRKYFCSGDVAQDGDGTLRVAGNRSAAGSVTALR